MKRNQKTYISRLRLQTAGIFVLLLTAFTSHAQGAPLVSNGQKIAFLGDSITSYGWTTRGGYVQLVVDGLAKQGVVVTPIPAGVGGHKSNDMLARLQNDVLSKKPDWMLLSCGVNDVWHGAKGVDLESYKKNITAIVDQAQAQGVKVVLLTATVIGEEPNDNNTRLEPYNDFLRSLAKERDLPLADLNAAFHKVLDPLNPNKKSRYLTVDSVHMNPDGNVLMAKGVLGALGVAPAEVDKIEPSWLVQKDTATLGNYPNDLRPNVGITLGQYRAVSKLAERNHVTAGDMVMTLWLRSLGEAVQLHAQDATIDADKLKNEAQAILAKQIEKLDAQR